MALELQQEAAPATPAAGFFRLFVDSTQLCPKLIDDDGLSVTFSRAMGVTTTSVSSTTTAETKSLVGTITGTFTVPANSMVVGRMFRIKARGVMTTGATAGTITWFLKYAGTTIASSGAVVPITSQNNMYWELEAEIVVRSIGASGTFFVQGHVHNSTAAVGAATPGTRVPIRGNSADPPAAVTVDTTASSLFDFQTTTSNNGHTITCNMAMIEVFN